MFLFKMLKIEVRKHEWLFISNDHSHADRTVDKKNNHAIVLLEMKPWISTIVGMTTLLLVSTIKVGRVYTRPTFIASSNCVSTPGSRF